jgi:hypothetical protein
MKLDMQLNLQLNVQLTSGRAAQVNLQHNLQLNVQLVQRIVSSSRLAVVERDLLARATSAPGLARAGRSSSPTTITHTEHVCCGRLVRQPIFRSPIWR